MSLKERNLQQDDDDDDDDDDSEDGNTRNLHNFINCKIEGMEDRLRDRLHTPKHTKATLHVKPMHAYRRIPDKTIWVIKVCYECRKLGHIWAFCPQLSPALPAPFLLPTDFILRIPYAHCLFAPIATYSRVSDYGMDALLIHWLHRTCFTSLQCPHHLIITLPFCTLHVATFSFILISNRRVQPVPPTIQRPMDL